MGCLRFIKTRSHTPNPPPLPSIHEYAWKHQLRTSLSDPHWVVRLAKLLGQRLRYNERPQQVRVRVQRVAAPLSVPPPFLWYLIEGRHPFSSNNQTFLLGACIVGGDFVHDFLPGG